MPSIIAHTTPTPVSAAQSQPDHLAPPTPLRSSGSLDAFESFDVTPAIGREYVNLQAKSLLRGSSSDALIRDLAITVSERGVVFLRNQEIDQASMKELVERMSRLAGSPLSSTLHTHPLTETSSELGDQVSVISSTKQAKGGGLAMSASDSSRLASAAWHADITFEPVPSDYAMLKIHTLPVTGGDTLWCSGYELYDALSESMAGYLEGLTATHDANFFHDEARRLGIDVRGGPRGHPLNVGTDLRAVHPVIRTNPVTGLKCLFVNRGFTKRINEVSKDESDMLLKYLFDLVPHNHNAQVRFKWRKNDMAIWDNRSNLHCATFDYDAERIGDRVVSLGEEPRFDSGSRSRKEMVRSGS